jgi:hypothetical protein
MKVFRHSAIQLLSLLLGCFMSATLFAQTLPPTSRTVFKCEVGGKVTYSDEPCLGAQRLEVKPTRGLDRISGKKQVGADIQREYLNEGIAQAVRPITGMNPQQWETHKHRVMLPPESQRECRSLDVSIPRAERDEQQTTPNAHQQAQQQLYELRIRFRELRC